MVYRFITGLLDPLVLLGLWAFVALIFLWRSREMSRRRLLWLTVPLALLFLATCPPVAYLAIGSLEWQYPPCNERPEGIEAIVVLSGGMHRPDSGRAEPELANDTLRRCLHGAMLYGQGLRCPVVLSGGGSPGMPKSPTLAATMREFMITQGVRPEDILLEDRSTTTYENAVFTAELLREHEIGKVLLVTDVIHLMRSERCFQKQGVDVVPSGCRYRATELKWAPRELIPGGEEAKMVQEASHEWIGIVWYWLRGRI